MIRLSLSVALLVALAPAAARACSCAFGIDLRWPEDGEIDVPINARVWVSDAFEELDDVQLRVAGETDAVAMTKATIATSFGDVAVLTPTSPLAPGTAYEVVACNTLDCDHTITRFTTGADADEVAPAVPEETDRDGGAGGGAFDSCGKRRWVDVELDAEGLVVMEVGAESFDPAALVGPVTFIGLEHDIKVGRGGCLNGWPGDAGRDSTVRYGAFDVAGNFSGWTEVDSLRIGRGCQCSADAAGGPAWLGALVVGLVLRRGRRRP